MSGMKDLIGKTAQTNYYQVNFSALKQGIVDYLRNKPSDPIPDVNNILTSETGLLCSDASLPTSSFATGEVKDNFMGINQEFAHTRIYTDLDFTFYVDNNYNTIRIFEGWMDFISGSSRLGELNSNYYRRFNYPDDYKVETMYITKFEKDYRVPGSRINYQFINAFPKTITSIPVSYGPADLLKVTVSFNYDRYIINPKGAYIKSNTSEFSDFPRKSDPLPTPKTVTDLKKKEQTPEERLIEGSVEDVVGQVKEDLVRDNQVTNKKIADTLSNVSNPVQTVVPKGTSARQGGQHTILKVEKGKIVRYPVHSLPGV